MYDMEEYKHTATDRQAVAPVSVGKSGLSASPRTDVQPEGILHDCHKHLSSLASKRELKGSKRRRYARALLTRWYLLERLVNELSDSALPVVNTTWLSSGISDPQSRWETLSNLASGSPTDTPIPSILAAPVGYGLHRVNGSAFKLLAELLETVQVPRSQALAADLGNYLEASCGVPYTDVFENHRAVAGAVTCGLLYDIKRTPINSENRMFRRLADLLDVCDLLSLERTETLLRHVEEYLDDGWYRRARRLLKTSAADTATMPSVSKCVARLECADGSTTAAIEACQAALVLSPESSTLHTAIATPLAIQRRYREAAEHLQEVVRLEPDAAHVSVDSERLQSLNDTLSCSHLPGQMPEIMPDGMERDAGRFHPLKLSLACYLFRKHGTLLIKDVFDQSLIEACRVQFMQRYADYFGKRNHRDALQIGSRRFQIGVSLDGAFNDPGFYGNPYVLQIMHELIGRKVIIGSTVCATSLPGSRDQHMHKDHRALFTQDADDPPMDIPPVAVTTMIPLVPLDEQVGTTIVKKGSHRLSRKQSAELGEQVPLVSTGSCFLMDLALSHKGQGNKTDSVRPIINMVYQQHWFADNKNFKLHPPLHVPAEEYDKIPGRYKSLFSWADQPFARVNC
ncbi:MAG: hypothetical protein HKN42_02220 [Granulosicoccus sp.]|nr:hypothetical protein [Granulosicoccus sp.]